ncbi:hypothetical protein HPB47_003664 [Ixodes persulcatus]|uniref:Uncharacterized protein n=1 Tax=Ixodes persulcatus TaxID=34615 RepID=A0AC60PJB3_IXOPE|nr:hypothetical protein HPB47_003664 [Ixodes persulcatus]
MEQYQQTEAYKLFTKKKHEKKTKGVEEAAANGPAAEAASEDSRKDDGLGFDIPIFTEEFLDHNKVCEAELRQLRKSNTEYEEQNAILSKHIDTMKAAIEKLEVETVQQKNNNLALQQHLTGLRSTLTTSFCNLPLPGVPPDEDRSAFSIVPRVATREALSMAAQRMQHTCLGKLRRDCTAELSAARPLHESARSGVHATTPQTN